LTTTDHALVTRDAPTAAAIWSNVILGGIRRCLPPRSAPVCMVMHEVGTTGDRMHRYVHGHARSVLMIAE